jgi:hypothetical protein
MRKSLLLKEYSSMVQPGCISMKNIKTYMGSQLIDIEDTIRINDNTITWSENTKQEQLGINEISRSENLYDVKYKYQTLISNKQEFPTVEFTIDVNSILIKYLYLMLKTNRTFEGLDTNAVNNLDISIVDFINYNIFDRYKFKSILLFVKYYPLDNTHLMYDVKNDFNITWNNNIRMTDNELINNNILVKNFEVNQKDNIIVKYKQTLSAKLYTFNYHYDLIFDRI